MTVKKIQERTISFVVVLIVNPTSQVARIGRPRKQVVAVSVDARMETHHPHEYTRPKLKGKATSLGISRL